MGRFANPRLTKRELNSSKKIYKVFPQRAGILTVVGNTASQGRHDPWLQ